jgi:hypothetical protein
MGNRRVKGEFKFCPECGYLAIDGLVNTGENFSSLRVCVKWPDVCDLCSSKKKSSQGVLTEEK